MPVSVRDLSGVLVGVEIAPAAMEDIDWGFQALEDANKVAIGWVSSACDKGATVTLETTQRGTLVTIEPQPVRGECPLGLTGRTVIVTFSRPVDVSSFELDAVTGATP